MAEISSSIYQHLLNREVPLDPMGAMQHGQRSAFGQLALQEARRQQQQKAQFEAELRQAYAQGGTALASGMGMAGAPGAMPGAAVPVQETVNTPYSSDLQTMLSQYASEGADVTPQPGPRTLPPSGMAGPPPGAAPGAVPGMARGQGTVLTPDVMRRLGMIDPQATMALEKSQRDSQKANFDMLEKQNRIGRQVTQSILLQDTQDAYTRGVAYLRSIGFPTDHLPAYYDRRMVEQYDVMFADAETKVQEAQSRLIGTQAALAPQKLALEERQETRLGKQYDLDLLKEDRALTAEERQQRMADETARHNRALEDKSGTAEERQQRQAEETARHNRRMEELQGTAAERAQTQQGAERENQLRDEYNTLSKDYRAQSEAYGRVQASAQDPSAAGDLSLIFSYMKILDPGSTVREGEQATAANARGVPEAIRQQYDRVMRGEKLGPEQRKDFVDRAQRLYDQATRDNQRIRTQYEERAQRYGVDPTNVTTEFGSSARQTLSEADIAATIADSHKPGNKPLTRQQVIEWGRKNQYQVPEQ